MKNENLSELTKKYLEETDDNVVAVSYGYKTVNGKITDEKAICFNVKKKIPISELTPDKILPKKIDFNGESYLTDVSEGNFELFYSAARFCYDNHYTWWDYYPQPPARITPAGRYKNRPLKGGVSVTNFSSNASSIGTLGLLAKDNEDDSLVGLSNNHVLINDAFIAAERTNPSILTNILNDVTTQPHEWFDNGLGNRIGIVKRYAPLRSTGYNRVDAAITTIDSTVASNTESWKQAGLTINTPMPFATKAELDNIFSTNPLLFSAGRTSGPKGELDTKLKLFATNVAVTIGYSKQGGSQLASFEDCMLFIASGATTPAGEVCFFPLAPGDSGSALIAELSGVKKIIGLCFAGDVVFINNPLGGSPATVPVSTLGVACRIDHIASELNISAWDGGAVTYSNTNNIQQHLVSGLSNEPYIEIEGKKYWQIGLI